MKGIDAENGNNWNEENFKILPTEETKGERFVFCNSKAWKQDNVKCSEEKKEKYNMGNEVFQRDRASQNKHMRPKMVTYSIGRNCNEWQRAQCFLNSFA